MLDPDTLEDLGNLVGAIYTEMEAEMCDILVRAILDNDVGFWRSQAALAILAQAQAPQLRMVLERYRDRISKATYREVEEALTRSDDYDLGRLREALGYEIPRISTVQITMAAQKIGEMLERDNLDMLTGARQALYREVSTAIAQVTGGLKSPHEATLEATRRLARRGIEVVQYKDPTTGERTMRNKVDVAVRRHIRSQMAQAAADRTMQVCDECGCGFVEVSSHYGARPSHQDWEGRVYSLNGRVTVDGVTYEDFGEATGYYGEGDHGALGDRLQGVNCRHHFGPWFPGMPRAYHPNPRHPSGKSNEEIYKLTQKQRRMERDLRDTKRELSAALENYKRYPNEKTQLAVNQLKAQLKSQNDKMKAFLAENKGILTRQPARESVGDMPRVKVPATGGRNTGQSQTSSLSPSQESGAIRGDEKRMNKHAERYYESVRKMDRQTVTDAISRESGLTQEEASRAFSHLFVEEHDLGENGIRRFFEDYEISQSVQRILLGSGICEHDRVLFQHELLESIYMADGLDQGAAHDKANLSYNYEEMVLAWLERGAKPDD